MQLREHRQNSKHFAYANLLAALIKTTRRRRQEKEQLNIYKKLKKYKVSFTVF